MWRTVADGYDRSGETNPRVGVSAALPLVPGGGGGRTSATAV